MILLRTLQLKFQICLRRLTLSFTLPVKLILCHILKKKSKPFSKLT